MSDRLPTDASTRPSAVAMMPEDRRAGGGVTLVHSSDLHLSADLDPDLPGGDHLWALRRVLDAARQHAADLVVLAGDVFDHNRQPIGFVEQCVALLASAGRPAVILPGNHDPLTPDSVYFQSPFARTAGVRVIGKEDEVIHFADLDLEVRGRAHRDYGDMAPLPEPRQRTRRWHVVVAHGHFVEAVDARLEFRGSWLFDGEALRGLGADYVALGHWNRTACVSADEPAAHYSGSPIYTGSVHLVRLSPTAGVSVRQTGIGEEAPAAAVARRR